MKKEDRERLGKLVRDVWVAWAKEQAVHKESWLKPWEQLTEAEKEVDRRIGAAVYWEAIGENRIKSMTVIVCGGRRYFNSAKCYEVLDAIHAKTTITLVINGGANGADSLARKWAQHRRVPLLTMWADWDGLGLLAGPARNREMIEFMPKKPDLVVAFPGGKGTQNMMTTAKLFEVPVQQVT